MTEDQKRRLKAQLKALGCRDEVAELVFLEINNAEWKGYGLGYRDGKEGKEPLDARVEPGWE